MNFFRRTALPRLLTLTAVVLVAVAGATALAAGLGTGPVPPARSLAQALHSAAAAPAVRGVTAQVSFTNHLVDGASLTGASNPLLSGAKGRLWIGTDGRLRLELQSDFSGDSQIVYDGRYVSYYDPASRTLYRVDTGPPASGAGPPKAADRHGVPSVAQIQTSLSKLMGHALLSGATPSDVAGRPAYQVRISPKADGGLIGGAALWWDAVRGVPLRIAVYAAHRADPVIELTATHISYGPVANSVFALPKAAKVVQVASPSGHDPAKGSTPKTAVQGVAAVRAALPFALSAPAQLAGMSLSGARTLDVSGHQAALVTYGQGLGGLAVIEQAAPADATGSAPASGVVNGLAAGQSGPSGQSGQSGQSSDHSIGLPTVKVGSSTATQLVTPLGSLVHFTRGAVAYTVLGSVSGAVSLQAAQGL